jgi:hypothetical protein
MDLHSPSSRVFPPLDLPSNRRTALTFTFSALTHVFFDGLYQLEAEGEWKCRFNNSSNIHVTLFARGASALCVNTV